ncbi:MAG: SUMF1/EgtB/PvdO family nonheme iron enzyme [Verrucomicrobiota bacterium]
MSILKKTKNCRPHEAADGRADGASSTSPKKRSKVARLLACLVTAPNPPRPPFSVGEGEGEGGWENAQMSIRLEAGDLPGAVQFVANSRRSGELALFRVDDGAFVGSIFFDERGKIIHAQHGGNSIGVDAVAALICEGKLDSRFIAGRVPAVSTLEHSADGLMLEATVETDQLSEDGDFKGGQVGSGAWQGSGRHISIMRIAISAGVFAVLVWGVGLAGPRAWKNLQRDRMRQQQIQESAETREERVQILVNQAREAYTRRRYNVTIELCAEALELNPEHTEAQTILEKAQSPHSAGDARRAQANARMVRANLAEEQAESVLPEETADLDQRLETARKLMGFEEYRGAVEVFEGAVKRGNQMLARLERHENAISQREAVKSARERAKAVDGSEYAEHLWTAAEETAEQAESAFERGAFGEAARAWQEADGMFADTIEVAKGQRELAAAEKTLKEVLRTVDPELLEEFGGDLWRQVRDLRRQAGELRADQQFQQAAEHVDEARRLVPKAAKQARELRNQQKYRKLMNEGERLEAEKRWQEAENVYAEALAVPDFEDSSAAKKAHDRMNKRLDEQRRREELAASLRRAREAVEQKQWYEVLDQTDAALELHESHEEALRLQRKALAELPPLLTVRTRVDGAREANGAEIYINGILQSRRTPCQFAVETGRAYRIDARMAVEGEGEEERMAGGTVSWSTDDSGRYTVWVELESAQSPRSGEAFAVAGTWIRMRPVEPGTYTRPYGAGENTLCEVRVDKPFWVADIETTRLARKRIMGEKPLRTEGFLPAVGLSRDEMTRICRELTKREREADRLPEGYVYRLPTEAEWELVCRAGWEGDPPLGKIAWHAYNSDGSRQRVATRSPNRLGVYDLLGNASELCGDWVPPGPDSDEEPPDDKFARRGGSARSDPADCTPEQRFPIHDGGIGADLGFRFVLAPEDPGELYHWIQEDEPPPPEPGEPWRIGTVDLTFVPLKTEQDRDFWAACHEITQRQYKLITGGNVSQFDGENRPVESVTWEQARRFCKRLTEKEQAANRLPLDMAYRLPTLREWRVISDNAERPAKPKRDTQTHPVQSVESRNPILTGVFDNVQEWCLDWRDRDGCGLAPSGRSLHEEACPAAVGGSWFDRIRNSQAASIYGSRFAASFIGFRIVLSKASAREPSLLCEQTVQEQGPQWTSAGEEDIEMAFVMPGRFEMGRNDGEQREGPSFPVLISRPFWIARHEVTEGQFERMMQKEARQKNRPVGGVTWNEAMAYCDKLTEAERQAGTLPYGYVYRLPTEAEWEFACKLSEPDGPLRRYAWFEENSDGEAQPVGRRQADDLGLYDLRGNVWEWCYDWYVPYDEEAKTDPWGAVVGSHKVYRGGSFGAPEHMCTPSYRVAMGQYFRNEEVGFRVVLAPALEQKENQ